MKPNRDDREDIDGVDDLLKQLDERVLAGSFGRHKRQEARRRLFVHLGELFDEGLKRFADASNRIGCPRFDNAVGGVRDETVTCLILIPLFLRVRHGSTVARRGSEGKCRRARIQNATASVFDSGCRARGFDFVRLCRSEVEFRDRRRSLGSRRFPRCFAV